ncbi:MAG: 5'/3'-nucleotidase SurE [Phycisphaerales bacterium]
MRILLTNDDGITAPGIQALYHAIRSLGEIVVVAPATAQSAMSHKITFHSPILTREVRVNDHMTGVAVEGSPADCVKIATRAVWPERFGKNARPDLVISGLNDGANVGINVIYSGTVAAAVESAFLGVPSIAVSLHDGRSVHTHLARAAEIARAAIDRVLQHELDPHGVINVNIPRVQSPDAPVPPMRVASMNTAAGIDGYERRVGPGGQVYYWSSGNGMEFVYARPGTDVEGLAEQCVTITPLSYDLTDHGRLEEWRRRLG